MSLPQFLHSPAMAENDALEDEGTRAYQPVLGRWLIELALMLNWHCQGRKNRPWQDAERLFDNEEFMTLTGLSADLCDQFSPDRENETDLPTPSLTQILRQQRAIWAATPLDPDLPLPRNLSWLAEALGLNQAELALLGFTVFLQGHRLFERAIAQHSVGVSTTMLCQIMARLTALPEADLLAALHPAGVLMTTNLIQLRADVVDLEDKISTRRDFPTTLFTEHLNAETLLGRFLKRAPRSTLTLTHFPHLDRDTIAATGLLRAALTQKIKGTNVLLYGPPGVGKTEYAAVLAQTVDADLYEVNYGDEDGDPIQGTERLGAFNLCQKLLARRDNALLLFDEVEDVFERDALADLFGDGRGRAAGGKAWINRTLENNPAPALWITNDARSMDPAFLRRFDYAIRFARPPQSVRLDIARHHLGEWADDDDWLAQIAGREQITPAQLERAAKLARHAGHGDPDQHRELVLQALDRSARLLGQSRTPARNVVRTGYDLRYLNTGQDLSKLITALQRRPEGAFCFHGPAGTGKSELARHIADQLGQPLLVKRASNLLSPYVGETEQHLAAMFDEARQEGAVLVLDEADSFLRDRRSARQSWEVTQVNELLTQMEAFQGIFIATTNLMTSLDVASLRRFAWKIRFNALNSSQRWALFLQEFARLGGDWAEAADWRTEVSGLEGLTPGDFAVVVRQYELWEEIPNAQAFHGRLCAEVAAKREDAGAELPNALSRQPKNTTVYG